ncbi:uncharacterized protein LOC130673079 [Microplitis mediator]|uniref:uncharacterized protein LOC130673079 n=1 Tax=Microplitis mediator TaxID=375433 RepID=UPI002557386B|nr:uncharacterized protein LOC130673079 [Microplitis mediator]
MSCTKIIMTWISETKDCMFYKIKNFFIVLQYIFFKAVGLSPWTIDMSQVINNSRMINYSNDLFKNSMISIIYNCMIIIVMASFYIWVILFPNNQHGRRYDTIYSARIIAIGIPSLGTIITLITWFYYIVRKKKILNSTEKLLKLDKKLKELYCTENNYKSDYNFYIILFINFLLSFCLLIFRLRRLYWTSVLLEYIPSLVISWTMMQFSLVINVIHNQFKMINISILKLGNLIDNNSNYDDDELITSEIYYPRIIITRRIICGSIAHDLDNIKCIYSELCDVWCEIFNFYGLLILLGITYFGGHSMTTIYDLWLSIKLLRVLKLWTLLNRPKRYFNTFFKNFTSDILLLILIIFVFIVMTNIVTKTIQQSKKTSYCIHVLQNKCTMDDESKEKLCSLSLSLLQRKFECRVFDITSIDNSFLLTMFDTIMTYAVIIVQFRVELAT